MGAMMRALVYKGPRVLDMVQRERPIAEPGNVIVKVEACGICGSDVHGYLGITGRRMPDVAMGHEFSGIIVEIGENVSEHHVGERVIVQPIDHCHTCRFCKEGNTNLCTSRRLFGVLDVQGAMSEYVSVPEYLLITMANDCSFEIGALAEPLTVAYAAVEKIEDYSGKTVLIIGAGMIGLCILEMLKLKKPQNIIVSDLSNTRLKRAKSRGADHIINPKEDDFFERITQITDGKMCDITIEAVGVESSANQSIRALRKNGVSVWTGVSSHDITIDMQDVVTFQRTIIGSMNYTQKDFENTVKLLNEKMICTDGLITCVVGLDDAAAAFEDINNNPDDYLKVIIKP